MVCRYAGEHVNVPAHARGRPRQGVLPRADTCPGARGPRGPRPRRGPDYCRSVRKLSGPLTHGPAALVRAFTGLATKPHVRVPSPWRSPQVRWAPTTSSQPRLHPPVLRLPVSRGAQVQRRARVAATRRRCPCPCRPPRVEAAAQRPAVCLLELGRGVHHQGLEAPRPAGNQLQEAQEAWPRGKAESRDKEKCSGRSISHRRERTRGLCVTWR